jgi:hypothetical protein
MPSLSAGVTGRTPCKPLRATQIHFDLTQKMLRWLLIFLIASVLFNGLQGWLRKIGLGKLPGDFSFRLGGRDWYVPLSSSVVLTVIGMLIGLAI